MDKVKYCDADKKSRILQMIDLQRTIEEIKSSREMGARYMLFEEIKREEFRAGKVEGIVQDRHEAILELLDDYEVSEAIVTKVYGVTDLDMLKKMLKLASKARSIEEFKTEMESLIGE